jgi:DNA modification methylase
MSDIIREHGLASINVEETMRRTIGCEREEITIGETRLVKNDTILETADREKMPDNSVHLIVTSIPFSFQYEYSPSYNDLGHTESNDHFWAQMDFLAPSLFRVLSPGRVMAIHVKDRIVPGGVNGFGFQSLHPFHSEAIYHYQKHGFAFLGMKTVVTDVVRENNQTYRLGWTEQCKDGSRMGCGVPEYVLLFRKPPTDRSVGYADIPVVKDKPLSETPEGEIVPYDYDGGKIVPNSGYSRSRWQLDAHGFARSSGNRLVTPEELENIPHEKIFKKWREESLNTIYDFEKHVANCEVMERDKRLPSTFMIMPPASWHPDVWTDIARMRTLNMEQERRGNVMHLCPLQYDIVDRLITQFSMKGETVFDPFGGLMTVPYRAIKLDRVGMATELNGGYFRDGVRYCKMATNNAMVPSLFDLIVDEDSELID